MPPAATPQPAYTSIVVASDHSLWLEDHLHPVEAETRWFPMDEGFEPVGWIAWPPNERLLAAGSGRLVVLRKDELGVESVVVYGGAWPQAGR